MMTRNLGFSHFVVSILPNSNPILVWCCACNGVINLICQFKPWESRRLRANTGQSRIFLNETTCFSWNNTTKYSWQHGKKLRQHRGWQIFISKAKLKLLTIFVDWCCIYLFEFRLFLLSAPSILVTGADLQSTWSCLKMSLIMDGQNLIFVVLVQTKFS